MPRLTGSASVGIRDAHLASRAHVLMPPQVDHAVEIDALGEHPGPTLLSELWTGSFPAFRVRNLVSTAACQQLTERLLNDPALIDHSDVKGLSVLGLSHFQAARDSELARRYIIDAPSHASRLRSLSSPYASPFDSAFTFLAQCWSPGCQLMELPTEGILAPFTVRIYRDGVEIEPHQDILAAESPDDPVANSLVAQFAANIYLSMGSSGGALEIYDIDHSSTGYKDLSAGPRVISRDRLPQPSVILAPLVGDLIVFPSRHVHAVAPTRGNDPRITISFFLGIQDAQTQLKIWA